MAGDSGSQGSGGNSYPGGEKPGVIQLVFAASENGEYAHHSSNNNTDTQLPAGGGGAQQQHAANMRKRASATGDMEIPAAGGHGGEVGGTHGSGCTEGTESKELGRIPSLYGVTTLLYKDLLEPNTSLPLTESVDLDGKLREAIATTGELV